MPAKKKPERKKKHAEGPLVEARLAEVLQLRLDGASRWDVCQYVSEKEQDSEPSHWSLKARERPMSTRQVERYIAEADRAVRELAARLRESAMDRHLAQRQARYASCVLAGDNATALACLKDEAKLLDLYPAERKRHEHTGKDGKPIEAEVKHDAPAEYAPAVLAFAQSVLAGLAVGAIPADGAGQSLPAGPQADA